MEEIFNDNKFFFPGRKFQFLSVERLSGQQLTIKSFFGARLMTRRVAGGE